MTTPTSTTEAITVTLPLPPKELDPNGRHHWRAKMAPKRRYRCGAMFAALKQGGFTQPLQRARVRIRYYHKTKTFKDPDNIIACLKTAIDGLTDAGVFTDDRDLTYLPVERFKDKANPRVEIEITPLPH